MSGILWAKAHYLDASAMVKLVVDEGDGQPLRDFFNGNASFCTSPLCLGEALGVLKGKWSRGTIDENAYFAATRRLIIDAWGKRIEIDDIGFVTPSVLSEVELLAKKYTLDLSDALQIITVQKGRYARLGPNSASTLITADAKLGAAASSEGIRVWNCIASSAPGWA